MFVRLTIGWHWREWFIVGVVGDVGSTTSGNQMHQSTWVDVILMLVLLIIRCPAREREREMNLTPIESSLYLPWPFVCGGFLMVLLMLIWWCGLVILDGREIMRRRVRISHEWVSRSWSSLSADLPHSSMVRFLINDRIMSSVTRWEFGQS